MKRFQRKDELHNFVTDMFGWRVCCHRYTKRRAECSSTAATQKHRHNGSRASSPLAFVPQVYLVVYCVCLHSHIIQYTYPSRFSCSFFALICPAMGVSAVCWLLCVCCFFFLSSTRYQAGMFFCHFGMALSKYQTILLCNCEWCLCLVPCVHIYCTRCWL